jgi:hypothetical protein
MGTNLAKVKVVKASDLEAPTLVEGQTRLANHGIAERRLSRHGPSGRQAEKDGQGAAEHSREMHRAMGVERPQRVRPSIWLDLYSAAFALEDGAGRRGRRWRANVRHTLSACLAFSLLLPPNTIALAATVPHVDIA